MVPWSGYFEDVSSSSPFVTFPGRPGLGFTRCFRSGDVGRWAVAQNGRETLQILGRCNQMVKVRFFWIWLGGLENLEFTATKNDEKRGVDGVYLGLRKMVLYKPLLYIYIYIHMPLWDILWIYIYMPSLYKPLWVYFSTQGPWTARGTVAGGIGSDVFALR